MATMRSDPSYPREIVDEVWLLAEPIEGNDAALWRRDECGDCIRRQDYGKFGSPFGWGIFEASPGRLKPLHCGNFGTEGTTPDQAQDGDPAGLLELF